MKLGHGERPESAAAPAVHGAAGVSADEDAWCRFAAPLVDRYTRTLAGFGLANDAESLDALRTEFLAIRRDLIGRRAPSRRLRRYARLFHTALTCFARAARTKAQGKTDATIRNLTAGVAAYERASTIARTLVA